MKSHKISSGLKHLAGFLMSCLVFCSMFSQCEQERSLEEGNDVDFTLFGLSSFPEGLLLYSTGATSVEFDGKSLSCDVPLLSVAEEEASAPDFISMTITLASESDLEAGRVYDMSQPGTEVDIVLEYVSEDGGELRRARAENASMKVSLLSDRYITGTFSCDFTLMLPDGSGEAMTECECHADKGYFNIFLL